jgi:hypothetical protein
MDRATPNNRSLLGYIESLSVSDIEREIDRVRRERLRLRAQEQLLEYAKRVVAIESMPQSVVMRQASLLAEEEASEARGRTSSSAAGDEDADGADHELDDPEGAEDAPVASPSRVVVRAMLEAGPDRLWSPKDVHEELRRRGYNSKLPSTRVMLQRLHHAGELDRPYTGQYKASASAAARLTATSEDDQT